MITLPDNRAPACRDKHNTRQQGSQRAETATPPDNRAASVQIQPHHQTTGRPACRDSHTTRQQGGQRADTATTPDNMQLATAPDSRMLGDSTCQPPKYSRESRQNPFVVRSALISTKVSIVARTHSLTSKRAFASTGMPHILSADMPDERRCRGSERPAVSTCEAAGKVTGWLQSALYLAAASRAAGARNAMVSGPKMRSCACAPGGILCWSTKEILKQRKDGECS